MGTLSLYYARTEIEGEQYLTLNSAAFANFNPSLLDLGEISKDGKYFESLAAIFDLEAFTSFCNQIDPHLVVPEYLDEFLRWLFAEVGKEFTYTSNSKKHYLWAPLPFFAKFLGDGILFLWNTNELPAEDIGNVVVNLRNICQTYQSEFLPRIRKMVSKPPLKLRCGIARGQVISVGDGKDFVGPCMNVASRLQKTGQFSFAFSKRGFSLDKYFSESMRDSFTLIRIAIRGVGEEELVYVHTAEYELLSLADKKKLAP